MKWFPEKLFDQSGPLYYVINAILVGALVGLMIAKNDPLFIFVAFFLSVRLILFSNTNVFLYVITISVFFADWLHVLGLIPEQFTWIPDMILLFLMFRVVAMIIREKRFVRTSLDLPVIAFVFWGALSMFITGQPPVSLFISLRQIIKFSLLFYVIQYLHFDNAFFKRLIYLLIFLFAIQVPTAIIKMFIYGQGEHAIGTYAYFGGGLTAILPVIVISIALGFYFFYKSNIRYLIFVLYFQLFYIACPKRMYPFFAIVVFIYLIKISGLRKLKKLLPFSPVLVLVLGLLFYASPELRTIFDNPKSIVDWSTSYTYQKNDEQTSGRMAVAELVFNTLKRNPVNFAFGFGPGTVTESFDSVKGQVRQELNIYYGWTEFSMMALEYGFVGVILFLWILYTIMRQNTKYFKNSEDPFWKSISFGYRGICILYFMAFFYTTIFRLDVSAYLFWLLASIIYKIDAKRIVLE